ncbi:ABC transporter ATP-binding protein [soil metagenome]
MPPAIEARQLYKSYGDVTAVDGVDLTIEEGEVFALLGPNGAGKTTTVEILEGHRPRTSGEVSVLGFDPQTGGRPFREQIGIVLQQQAVEDVLTVREALQLYGSMFPKQRSVDELIDLVGLRPKAKRRIRTLSGGQKRRLELALGMVGDPDVLFLDEPTTGFDPSARRQAWTVVEGLSSLGKTVLLTTHYMDEAQQLADRLAVISSGRIIAEGTPATLGGRASAASVISFRVGASRPFDLPQDLAVDRSDDGPLTVTTTEPTRVLHRLTGWALEGGFTLDHIEVRKPSLEDVYLDLVGSQEGE